MNLAQEIERKFLVCNDDWKRFASAAIPMHQAYVAQNSTHSVRVRISGAQAHINIKTCFEEWHSRHEFEYPIPVHEAQTLLNTIDSRHIQKTRWPIMHAGSFWEIDVFDGDNAGLIVAEIELCSIDEYFEKPSWLGEEVTSDQRYYNTYLVKKPFKTWAKTND